MAKIRNATALDLPAMADMGEAMHDESPQYRDRSFNRRKCTHLALMLIESHYGCALVAEDAGELIGMFMGVAQEQYFGDDLQTTDLLLYVKPEARGGRAMLKLVRAYEAWAESLGATDVILGVSTGVLAKQTVHIYEKLGYTMFSYGLVKAKG